MNEPEKHETTPPPAPAGLSPRSRTLWEAVTADRVQGASRQLLLEEALRALDKAELARALVKQEGAVIRTESTGAVHAHPAGAIEKDAVRLAVKIFEVLGLNLNPTPPPEDPGPPSPLDELLASLGQPATAPKRKRPGERTKRA